MGRRYPPLLPDSSGSTSSSGGDGNPNKGSNEEVSPLVAFIFSLIFTGFYVFWPFFIARLYSLEIETLLGNLYIVHLRYHPSSSAQPMSAPNRFYKFLFLLQMVNDMGWNDFFSRIGYLITLSSIPCLFSYSLWAIMLEITKPTTWFTAFYIYLFLDLGLSAWFMYCLVNGENYASMKNESRLIVSIGSNRNINNNNTSNSNAKPATPTVAAPGSSILTNSNSDYNNNHNNHNNHNNNNSSSSSSSSSINNINSNSDKGDGGENGYESAPLLAISTTQTSNSDDSSSLQTSSVSVPAPPPLLTLQDPSSSASQNRQEPSSLGGDTSSATNNNEMTCRICMEGSSLSSSNGDDELIQPCHCAGSISYVHRGCLHSWRVEQRNSGGDNSKCTICNTPYVFSAQPPPLSNKDIVHGMKTAAHSSLRFALISAAAIFFVYVLPTELITQLKYDDRDYEKQSGRWLAFILMMVCFFFLGLIIALSLWHRHRMFVMFRNRQLQQQQDQNVNQDNNNV